MIKRGGEQVWPNQVDSIIQAVKGVATVVTFGVPNPLLGEEVATAVVPTENELDLKDLERRILETCSRNLEPNAVPQQIRFVASSDDLLTGSTGKFLRAKMAEHLQLGPVEIGALRVLEMAAKNNNKDTSTSCEDVDIDDTWEKRDDRVDQDTNRIIPDESLNGLRYDRRYRIGLSHWC